MPARRTSTPAVQPVSLQEAKRHLRVDFDDADDDIQALIEVATRAAEDRTERTLITTSWALQVADFRIGQAVELSNQPIIGIDHVEYRFDTVLSWTLPPTDYVLRNQVEAYRIQGDDTTARNCCQYGRLTIHYTAGYGPDPLDVPAPIRHWIKLAVGDLWAHRTRSAEKPAVPQGFADGLLDPYRMWGC